jgi:hypothetical protein
LRGEEVQSDGSGKVEVDEDEGSRGSRSISFSSFACFYDRILSIFVFHERFYPFPCPISLVIVTLAFLLLYWCIALWYYCLFGVFCVEMRLEAGNLEQHTWGRGYEIERSSLPKRKARTILYCEEMTIEKSESVYSYCNELGICYHIHLPFLHPYKY